MVLFERCRKRRQTQARGAEMEVERGKQPKGKPVKLEKGKPQGKQAEKLLLLETILGEFRKKNLEHNKGLK